MYNMVAEIHGVKKYKPGDAFKAMTKKHKDKGVTKKDCEAAMRTLTGGFITGGCYANGCR